MNQFLLRRAKIGSLCISRAGTDPFGKRLISELLFRYSKMKSLTGTVPRLLPLFRLTLFLFGLLGSSRGQTPSPAATLPSETPAKVEVVSDSFDYVKRDVMVAMRDGVRLHTVILIPKGAKDAPILLTRTPYDANAQVSHAQSSHLGPRLYGYDNPEEVIVEGGYIRAIQDVRGKYGSEGDYVMTRPLQGPLNPTPVDHSTDTYDTIDWLVKNVPESNGRVGILGISYDGFLPLMALVNPHPALKVAVPMNPMVDGWKGDDWFHNGAFREQNMPYVYEQEATRDNKELWWTDHFDDYDLYLSRGIGRRTWTAARIGAGGILAQTHRASQLRCLVATAGYGSNSRRPTPKSARNAGRQSVGSGRYLRGTRSL